MKKTMFITSVIMVVVMAIALTTSSLAWFSASGSANVTTSTLKLQATGGTSTGIAISSDGTQWTTNIILSPSGTTGLNPLVPFTGISNLASAENSDVLAAVISNLVGRTEVAYDADNSDTYADYGTTVDATPYAATMIGNKIDTNTSKFTNDVYRTGFYTDTLYLKNLATGANAANIKFDVDIAFSFNDAGTNKIYNSSNRGANKYQEDAVLCVAVLARIDEFASEANLDDNTFTPDSGEYTDAAAYKDSTKWELVGYADSKGNSTIALGKNYEAFLPGATYATSFVDKNISVLGLAKRANPAEWTSYNADASNTFSVTSDSYVKTSTEELRPERLGVNTGLTLPATVKTVKVIAWYDGVKLNNSNSSKADLQFSLKFNRVAIGG